MKLKAKMGFVYANRTLRVGDVFEAPDADAELLVRVGRANKEVTPVPMRYETRVAAPEGAPESADVVVEAPRRKRQYHRRDATAEE